MGCLSGWAGSGGDGGAFAVDDDDVEGDGGAFEDALCDGAGLESDRLGEGDALSGGELKGLEAGVGVKDLLLEFGRGSESCGELGELGEVELTAGGVKIEAALGKLGDLGEASGDGDARHGMGADVFEHAADEVAHVDEGALAELIEVGDGGL
jgi:hypothetical protein